MSPSEDYFFWWLICWQSPAKSLFNRSQPSCSRGKHCLCGSCFIHSLLQTFSKRDLKPFTVVRTDRMWKLLQPLRYPSAKSKDSSASDSRIWLRIPVFLLNVFSCSPWKDTSVNGYSQTHSLVCSGMERTSFPLMAKQLDETFSTTCLGDAIWHVETHLLVLLTVVRFLN